MSQKVDGLGSWIWQRISALYLGFFLIYFVISLLLVGQFDFEQWRAWVAAPFNSVILVLGFVMLILHAWIGLRDVILDYVHPFAVRATVLVLAGFALLGCLVWALQILLRTMPL